MVLSGWVGAPPRSVVAIEPTAELTTDTATDAPVVELGIAEDPEFSILTSAVSGSPRD